MSNIKYRIKGENYLWDTRYILEATYEGIPIEIEEIDTDSEEYIMRDIPKEFHSTLSYMAYDRGHAYGMDEVRLHLKNFVEELQKPIEEFRKNLLAVKN
jgi:hypothetical protein